MKKLDGQAKQWKSSYVNIIFNNGSEQTVDIALSVLGDNNAFMLDANTGRWTVKTWTYTPEA